MKAQVKSGVLIAAEMSSSPCLSTQTLQWCDTDAAAAAGAGGAGGPSDDAGGVCGPSMLVVLVLVVAAAGAGGGVGGAGGADPRYQAGSQRDSPEDSSTSSLSQ